MSALLSQPTYGTQPLPAASSLLAASGQSAPAPYFGGGNNKSSSNAAYPAYGSGYGATDDYADADAGYGASAPSPLNATAAYGSPAYSGSNGAGYGNGASAAKGNGTMSYALSPAPAPYAQSPSAYSQTQTPSAHAPSSQTPAAYAPSGASPSLRNTQMYGQTLTNWQPALPVSPWGTPEKAPVIGGGVETETVLRSDLQKLRRSRIKGWVYFVVLLGLSGVATYYGLGDRQRLVSEKNDAADKFRRLDSVHRETLARVREEAATGAPKLPSTPGLPGAAATGAASAGVAAVASPATLKLADELKRAMAGAPQLSIETRGDRVV
ncbi:MAG TPA: hypothetical protein VGG33_11105, partial [Polyangia bacterium]